MEDDEEMWVLEWFALFWAAWFSKPAVTSISLTEVNRPVPPGMLRHPAALQVAKELEAITAGFAQGNADETGLDDDDAP